MAARFVRRPFKRKRRKRPRPPLVGEQTFLLNGSPLQIRCGEIHFARVPREYLAHRLKMAKAMGLSAVCGYLFWNFHEGKPRQYDWSGTPKAAGFCSPAQKEGLWVRPDASAVIAEPLLNTLTQP